jgi:Fe-S-cluster containining protein
MTATTFDCVTCGACCFSTNPRYLVLLPEDDARTLPADAVFEEDGRRYVRFEGGHCVLLRRTESGQLVCGVYEQRPEACRAFRAGSFECQKARRANGLLGEKVAHTPCAAADAGTVND